MNHSLYRFLNVETGLDHQIFVWLDLWLAWPEQWLDLWLAWFSPQWLGTCLRLEGYDFRLACDLHMNDLPPTLPFTLALCVLSVKKSTIQPTRLKPRLNCSKSRLARMCGWIVLKADEKSTKRSRAWDPLPSRCLKSKWSKVTVASSTPLCGL